MKKTPIYSLYKKISDILGEMMNNRNEKKNPKIGKNTAFKPKTLSC